jgi:hypothetical protein
MRLYNNCLSEHLKEYPKSKQELIENPDKFIVTGDALHKKMFGYNIENWNEDMDEYAGLTLRQLEVEDPPWAWELQHFIHIKHTKTSPISRIKIKEV